MLLKQDEHNFREKETEGGEMCAESRTEKGRLTKKGGETESLREEWKSVGEVEGYLLRNIKVQAVPYII